MLLLQLFERRASAFPDALAIACEGRRVTYRELNLAADRIAYELKEAGVVSGTLVAVLVDRSPEMVAALLGIWKAGGAYIPLDPALPRQRLAFMLEDAAPPLLLTQRKFLSGLGTTPRVVDLDDLCATQASLPSAESVLCRDSPAYVVYTSGSTGKPKGASITHGGLANTIEAVNRDLMLRPQDIVLAWSTLAFDVACLEIYLPLVAGASLYLVTRELAGGRSRIEQLRRSAATVMLGTPTMYRLLLEEGWQGHAAMQLIAGGEVLPLDLARNLAGRCRLLWNQYGPTETSICVTREKIQVDAEKITIGHPLANVRIHLLDKDLRPVPTGSIGEMYIGGAGVSLGYLNRPELNQTCFLQDPFAEGTKGRLYKSGDLAVQLPDGRFDFIGRVDGQVKIRGFRIEIEEIESALRQCAGIQAAVVRAIELEPGDRRLVAFVVSHGRHASKRWKEALRRRLPAYMIPSEFVSLRHFPTTPSGKTDLQALDAMRSRATGPAPARGASAGDATETWLKATWGRLLKLRIVGIHDDFFSLGGHSLLAARMLAQVEARFGCRVPHAVLVEDPTIHGLATYLRQSPAKRRPALVTIQAGAHRSPLFIAHGLGGSSLSFMELAAELGREQPVYGLELPFMIDDRDANLTVLAANYLRQVRAIQPSGPYHLAGHSSGGLVVYEMACQLIEQGEAIGLLALLDCDLDTGKSVAQPFHGWASLKASFTRVRARFKLGEIGARQWLRRRMDYQRIAIRTWLAARALRTGGEQGKAVRAEGYLALAMREYELRPYPGKITLLIAQDEPRLHRDSTGDPTQAWAARIPGSCESLFVRGTHQTMLTRPHVASLARELRQRMQGDEAALRQEESWESKRKQESLASL